MAAVAASPSEIREIIKKYVPFFNDTAIDNLIKAGPQTYQPFLDRANAAMKQQTTTTGTGTAAVTSKVNYQYGQDAAKQASLNDEFGDLLQLNNFNYRWLQISDEQSYSMALTYFMSVRMFFLDCFFKYYINITHRHKDANWHKGFNWNDHHTYVNFKTEFGTDGNISSDVLLRRLTAPGYLLFFATLCITNLKYHFNDLLIFSKISRVDAGAMLQSYIVNQNSFDPSIILTASDPKTFMRDIIYNTSSRFLLPFNVNHDNGLKSRYHLRMSLQKHTSSNLYTVDLNGKTFLSDRPTNLYQPKTALLSFFENEDKNAYDVLTDEVAERKRIADKITKDLQNDRLFDPYKRHLQPFFTDRKLYGIMETYAKQIVQQDVNKYLIGISESNSYQFDAVVTNQVYSDLLDRTVMNPQAITPEEAAAMDTFLHFSNTFSELYSYNQDLFGQNLKTLRTIASHITNAVLKQNEDVKKLKAAASPSDEIKALTTFFNIKPQIDTSLKINRSTRRVGGGRRSRR